MFSDLQSLEDVRQRFIVNWNGYLHKFRYWLMLLLITGVADTISTIHFMTEIGAENEAHPAIRFVSMIAGPFIGPIIGKICQYAAIIAITVFFRKQAVFVFIPVTILYAWAAWFNIWGSHLYHPRLLWIIEYFS